MFQILPDRCTLIVKKEILYYFTIGMVTWLSGFIFIDRKNRDPTIKIMSEAADTMVRDNVPIIPVVMSCYLPFFNTKLNKFTTGEVTIQILPPIKTEGLSPSDVPELTDRVRETMISTFHELSGSPSKQSSSPEEDAHQATSSQES
nr:PREDICTED: 1-acyl-sn-glycerol-3-phosphate acyltransferase alpha isoform X2 [Anolis carolinensis]|eukprot:XP_016847292.1 PREDICTED: 1-acyl-sn-glycerol-3-phosphate acyltransferase alpha isoform X2 [Anolis carolinensis]